MLGRAADTAAGSVNPVSLGEQTGSTRTRLDPSLSQQSQVLDGLTRLRGQCSGLGWPLTGCVHLQSANVTIFSRVSVDVIKLKPREEVISWITP